MSIEGQGHFFTIYFPGFVCFVLYLDKISGERLQDHWSSGFRFSLNSWNLINNQRTNGPVNAHLISWPSKAHNIQNLENIW